MRFSRTNMLISSPHRGSPARRGHGSDRAGLGGEVQRPWARGLDQPQAARAALETHRRASRGPAGHRRARAHSGDPRCGALAFDRPDRVALGGVPPFPLQADAVARVAGHELSQALGPSAPSRQERGRGGGFLKNFPARLEEIAQAVDGKPIEIWFADEARIGQKNKITRRWAKRGTRPSAPKDQRTASAYIFGAICPAQGKGVGLVLPRCTTAGMTLHLKEISQAVTPGAHALLLVDQAGWHQSKNLVVPANITLVPLPSKSLFECAISGTYANSAVIPQHRPSASSRLWPARPAAICLPDACGLGCDSHGSKDFSGKLLEFLTQTGSQSLRLWWATSPPWRSRSCALGWRPGPCRNGCTPP